MDTTALGTTAPAATTAPAPAHRTTTAPGRRGTATGPTARGRSTAAAPAERRHLQLVGAGGPGGAHGAAAAGDAGMATAEYAIATLAACGFAALLVAILGGGEVRGMLLALVERALSVV